MLNFEALEDIKLAGNSQEEMFTNEVLFDFWICCLSREVSILGRREVLTGKAKFGILGDGKEVPQVAMARSCKKGDWRSGYYRDQTLMFALGLSTVEQFFAQLYADADNDPFSGGRQMNCHYATPIIGPDGQWKDHLEQFNNSADVSSTAGQMARAVGLSLASKLYRKRSKVRQKGFSKNGNEVCFVTIGDASTSEGIFWEALNAAGVQKLPMAISVWDDGYGISVPVELQTTKGSISKVLEGFHIDENGDGISMYSAKGWDYPTLCEMYERGIAKVRETHTPALFHVTDVTQPQGHSTSGSHERYKNPGRLKWEVENDCIAIMGNWMVDVGIAEQEKIDEIRKRAKVYVRECKNRAWEIYYKPVSEKLDLLKSIYSGLPAEVFQSSAVQHIKSDLDSLINPLLGEIHGNARRLRYLLSNQGIRKDELKSFIDETQLTSEQRYDRHLYSDTQKAAVKVPVVHPVYSDSPDVLNGYQILNQFFDHMLKADQNIVAFGEDVGQIGDVNQGFAGLQLKYGVERVFDSGIREWTIIGQAIGLALRGYRPIAEIQYIDYLVYGLAGLTDDLATLRYRSNGIQHAPAIIRTRGHRLEGIWHAGSPMSLLLASLRGMYICVPRNMVQAAGMYRTLLLSDDPAIVVECLNGYRLKERKPENLGTFSVPLGVPEILHAGNDVTLVTYGSCVRIAQEAVEILKDNGIDVELIDIQTLLPFDLESAIVRSLQKTNRLVLLDEDIPGGATAYMMQEILEKQNGYQWLDSPPMTLTAKSHRPPYGSDGDYFSKPGVEDIVECIHKLMRETNPTQFPAI